jgi:methionyl-tRNA formyltransferase
MMRIEFLTQDDPLYILPFFEEFLRHYSTQFEIVRVSSSPTMGKRSRVQMVKELTTLYGPVGMAALSGATLAAKLLGRFPRRQDAKRFYGIRQICSAYGIEYIDIGNPNAPEFLEGFQERKPDVLVSIACPYILKEKVLSVPPMGCVNIHHAPLPKYKGMMPTFWQMYHGEGSLGVTVHFMSAKLDEGDGLLQEGLTVSKTETLHNVIRRSKRHGAHVMARALRALESGSYVRIPLDREVGSYFTFPTLAQIRDFQKRGYRAV